MTFSPASALRRGAAAFGCKLRNGLTSLAIATSLPPALVPMAPHGLAAFFGIVGGAA